MNHKQFPNFLKEDEQDLVIEHVNSINHKSKANNKHLKHLVRKLQGSAHMYDISKNEITKEITTYQSGGNDVMKEELPEIFYSIQERITKTIGIPNQNSFLQIVDMNKGGTVGAHYDASLDGYVNYKCNISLMGEDYTFVIDNKEIHIKEGDLYSFEASLYKHWTLKPFTSRRILLSYGFILPYKDLGRDEDDPRIRLSKRIRRMFQRSK